MNINANFDRQVLVHSSDLAWVDSPMAGVSRRPLDRVGAEVARATSVVRYAPKSRFSPHTHAGGEEFLVLQGTFQDEYGDYSAGSYVRNPPQTRHTPRSENGCIILVKLWQFDPSDSLQLRTSSADIQFTVDSQNALISRSQLHENDYESVSMQLWRPRLKHTIPCPGGCELFVLSGELYANGHHLRPASWIRVPVGASLALVVGNADTKVWIKERHLLQVPVQLRRLHRAVS